MLLNLSVAQPGGRKGLSPAGPGAAWAAQPAGKELLQTGARNQGLQHLLLGQSPNSVGERWQSYSRALVRQHCRCCACKHMVWDLQRNSATLDWIRMSPVLNSSLVQSNQFTPMLVCARFFSSGYPDKSKQRRSLHFHCLSEMYLILLYIPFLGRVIC